MIITLTKLKQIFIYHLSFTFNTFLVLKAQRWNQTWSTKALWHICLLLLMLSAFQQVSAIQQLWNWKFHSSDGCMYTYTTYTHSLTLPTHTEVRLMSILNPRLSLAVPRLQLLACCRSRRHGSEFYIFFSACCKKREDGVSPMQTPPRTEVSTCTNTSATKRTTALAISTWFVSCQLQWDVNLLSLFSYCNNNEILEFSFVPFSLNLTIKLQ